MSYRLRPLVALSAAVAAVLFASTAQASPIFTITPGSLEAIGDAGGTNFGNPTGSVAGKGLPTINGGWPDTPSFAPDPSFGGARGISGYSQVGTALFLSEAAT